MSTKEFPSEPCRCGCILYQHVEGTPEDQSGWECTECGRGFIPDPVQEKIPFSSLPYSVQENLSMQDD